MSDKKQCCVNIYEGRRGFNTHKCTRPAVVEFGGKSYCKLHDPAAVKKRDDESARKYKEKWERLAKRELARAYRLVEADQRKQNRPFADDTAAYMRDCAEKLERELEAGDGN